MKIVFVYSLTELHPSQRELAERTQYWGPRPIGVVEDDDAAEECVSKYAEKTDDRDQAYLVVDAAELIVDPIARKVT